jgi:hypothetical protein
MSEADYADLLAAAQAIVVTDEAAAGSGVGY